MRFLLGHANHPDPGEAISLALAQIEQQRLQEHHIQHPNFGFVYFTDDYAPHAQSILDRLKQDTTITDWVGSCAHGIFANQIEYIHQPAISIMLAEFEPDQIRFFSGKHKAKQEQGFTSHSALLHIDAKLPDIADLIEDMRKKLRPGALQFGALLSGQHNPSLQISQEILYGGLSGVMWGDKIRVLSRITQGCQPLAGVHRVTNCDDDMLHGLDEKTPLNILLEDLDTEPGKIIAGHQLERIANGLFIAHVNPGNHLPIAENYHVSRVESINAVNGAMHLSIKPHKGMKMMFCIRDAHKAQADLIRVCTAIRDEMESFEALTGHRIKGVHYISCLGRKAQLFAQHAELRIIKKYLGDVPIIGFIGGKQVLSQELYGQAGVLSVFF